MRITRPGNRTPFLVFFVIALSGAALGLAGPKVKPKAPPAIQSFDPGDVRLLPGPFFRSQELDRAYLLKIEPDRLLARFRKEAGLPPKAPGYNGWEADTISGHSLGHYLSACAWMYRATDDRGLLEKVKYIVDDLAVIQTAFGDGYLAGIPKGREILGQVAKGDIRSRGFDLNGLWVPFYVLHKEMAGLRDAYRLCGLASALEIERKLADWVETTVSGLSHDQMQQVLACEHGGINEVLADLYSDTGEARYLALSRRFHHEAILKPLARGEDILPGKHGNTNIPKLIGLARRFELAGDPDDRAAAEFFWDRVVHHHSYVTGGHGMSEYFGPPDKLSGRLSPATTETCNVYNMLKLTHALFGWKGEPDKADFYERALFNHILASQDPADGRVVYNLSLAMGGYKQFQDPFEDFTCCVGTGMENHARHGAAIYFHDREVMYVNLFIASEVAWRAKGVTLRQETDFPDGDTVKLRLTCRRPETFGLKIHRPYWAGTGWTVKVNGREAKAESSPSSYAGLWRTWKTGDVVEVKLPLALRLEPMPDNPNRAAVMHGPLVLAGVLGAVDDPAAGEPDFVPALVTEGRPLESWLKPVSGKSGVFQTSGVGRPRDVELMPLYRVAHQRYTVYWDLFTPAEWDAKKAEYRAEVERRRDLESRTVDFFQPGEMQPERDHDFQGEKTYPGDDGGRKFRDARDGGWFSFDITVKPDAALSLACTYWGSDANRTFDVLVDGEKLVTVELQNKKPGQYYDEIYPLPPALTQGKTKITIKFVPWKGKTAGGLYGARVVQDRGEKR